MLHCWDRRLCHFGHPRCEPRKKRQPKTQCAKTHLDVKYPRNWRRPRRCSKVFLPRSEMSLLIFNYVHGPIRLQPVCTFVAHWCSSRAREKCSSVIARTHAPLHALSPGGPAYTQIFSKRNESWRGSARNWPKRHAQNRCACSSTRTQRHSAGVRLDPE